MRIPRSFEQLKQLNDLLKRYRDIHPFRIVICYVVTYLLYVSLSFSAVVLTLPQPPGIFPAGIHVPFYSGRCCVGRSHRAAPRMLLRGNRSVTLLSHLSRAWARIVDAAEMEVTDGQVGTQDRGKQGEYDFVPYSAQNRTSASSLGSEHYMPSRWHRAYPLLDQHCPRYPRCDGHPHHDRRRTRARLRYWFRGKVVEEEGAKVEESGETESETDSDEDIVLEQGPRLSGNKVEYN